MKSFAMGVFLAFLTLINGGWANAQDVKTFIPEKAYPLIPVFQSQYAEYFPELMEPAYPFALSEHESCISLKHSRCFSPTSSFKTTWKETGNRREEGAGILQLTRAWYVDGRLRMDTLANLKRLYPKELGGLSWDNVYQSPTLQIRAQALLLKDDYKNLHVFSDPQERLKATDSAYNGGRRDVLSARKNCGLTKGCNPDIWFNNVEKHCVKSKKALYSGRSACDINTHHVRDVFQTRLPKYQRLLYNRS